MTADLVLVESSRASARRVGTKDVPPPLLIYLASLGSERSRTTQLRRLNRVAELLTNGRSGARGFPWHELRREHFIGLRSRLQAEPGPDGSPLSPAYGNALLAATRSVLRECWRADLLTAEDLERACDTPPIRGASAPKGRSVSAGERVAVFAQCQADPSPAGARDAAILAFGFACGLRRSEIVGLDLDDYDPQTGAVVVRRGKGNKARTTYLGEGCRGPLSSWLRLRGTGAGPLFQRIRRGGHILPDRLSDQSIRLICAKRAKQAGVATFQPHDLRRSFAGDLLDAGADLAIVQRAMGHASPATTSAYDRRPEEAQKSAAARLVVPWS